MIVIVTVDSRGRPSGHGAGGPLLLEESKLGPALTCMDLSNMSDVQRTAAFPENALVLRKLKQAT